MNTRIQAVACVLLLLTVGACSKAPTPASPLDTAARRTCMDTIESRAVNRNSIAYDTKDEGPVVHQASGELELTIKFSAKNEIGSASSLQAQCRVSADGKKLVDIKVKDSR